MPYLRTVLSILVSGICLIACTSNKRLTDRSVYFKDISDSVLRKVSAEYEPIFQKGDILSISVITSNEKSTKMFNQLNVVGGTNNMFEASSGNISPVHGGYLINEMGNIIFPYLGAIKAVGISREALTNIISNGLRQYVDSAIVSIRLLNYHVTVLGEVTRPGTFSIPSERITVLDAIGLAGDLTIYGKRNNIRVIRTTEGKRETAVLNLNSGNIFDSPYFYLRQNDIVYVELNERKIPNTDQASLRNVSIGLGIISAIGVIISTINVLR